MLMTIFAGVQSYRVQLLKNKLLTENAAALSKTRTLEQDWSRAVYDIVYNLEVRNKKRNEESQAIIDSLRSRKPSIIVRDRFSCPSTPSASSTNDGEGERGLLSEDVEFLLSEAKRADSVVDKLEMCQIYVEKIHEFYSRSK